MENKNKTYESSTKRLYEIIDLIESGNVTLDDVNLLINEAKELIEFCYTTLDKTKGKLFQIKESLGKLEEE